MNALSPSIRVEQIGNATLYLGDCREVMPMLSGVNAVVTDPPYHGVKDDDWDNQWKNDAEFLDFIRLVSRLADNALASNGSLYHFASPQMAARIECVIRERFNVLNNIVWDKSGSRKGVGGTGIDVSALRCFWSANGERIIFAEKAAADENARATSGYDAACNAVKVSVFGSYLRSNIARAGVTNKQIAALFPSKTGGTTGCVSNWLLGYNVPTTEQYEAIRCFLGADFMRREYEDMRRPFFASPGREWGDIWKFQIERKIVHPTQKPLALMSHIVSISTRAGDVVLDPFMGSGSTGVSCINLGRSFIGIERETSYFEMACQRIAEAIRQPDMFVSQPKEEPSSRRQCAMFDEPEA